MSFIQRRRWTGHTCANSNHLHGTVHQSELYDQWQPSCLVCLSLLLLRRWEAISFVPLGSSTAPVAWLARQLNIQIGSDLLKSSNSLGHWQRGSLSKSR